MARIKLFLVSILTIVTIGLAGFFFAQPAEAQLGGCSISSFSMDPTPQYSLGVAVILSGTSNCGTVKFEILQGSTVVRTLSEIGQPNQTATWHTNETGSGNFNVCFVARGNTGWDQANRSCRAVYVEGSSGPPPGSQPGENVRCWVNNLVVTPSSAPVGHTFNFSGQGQCDGNLRAVRFTVAGSPYGEFGGNTTSATWNSSGRSTGNVRICFQATAGTWSQAAESCTTITLTATNTQPSINTSQGAPATNNQPPQTNQSNPNTFPPAQPPPPPSNSSSNSTGSTGSSSSSSSCSSNFGITSGIRARVMLDPPISNRMRSGAGTSNSVIDTIDPGEEFDIIGGPSCANGYVWWQVRYSNRTGWTAEGSDGQAWIERVRASTTNNSNNSGSSNTTGSSNTGSSGGTTLLTGCTPNHGLATGIRARVTLYPAYHNNVRSNPGTGNSLLFQVAPGESFDIIGGPRCNDDHVWWQIRYNNQTGWMAEGPSTQAWIERVDNQSASQSNSRNCRPGWSPSSSDRVSGWEWYEAPNFRIQLQDWSMLMHANLAQVATTTWYIEIRNEIGEEAAIRLLTTHFRAAGIGAGMVRSVQQVATSFFSGNVRDARQNYGIARNNYEALLAYDAPEFRCGNYVHVPVSLMDTPLMSFPHWWQLWVNYLPFEAMQMCSDYPDTCTTLFGE